MNPWTTGALGLLIIWILIYLFKPKLRKEMLWVSFLTMPLGLTEPLFVPAYWNPPSLFNLAATTGFDIESFIFSFSVGGIAAVLYKTIFKTRERKLSRSEIGKEAHRYHLLAILSPVFVFTVLYLFTKLNPIYDAIIALLVGAFASILCRPDLLKLEFESGILFSLFYFLFFVTYNLIYPEFVISVWNLSAISGILILGVPLEEIVFAFALGMMWSGVYEHVSWLKIKRKV